METLEKYFGGEPGGYFYREKTFVGTDEEYLEAKKNSSTIFVSNVPTNVREERIWELFLLCGAVKRVIMGLNRNTLRFCGFCFVEFYEVCSADMAVRYINGFRIDQVPLTIDKDYGFVEGRQYGRGVFGGRVKADKMYLEDKHQRDGVKRRRQGRFLR
ncbi:putative RNA-binding protein [Encephalitozoon intestinalis ATCC 50506]|uniref:Nuclear cap-binding protein subunit 2 n=1 Tax=Encephalitozoon intestinalis (strain ATCC 50506) TaxID=876142 RepID=E0S674_ENCIT|nr:putative RNA-binding protein [Encephalitozoon intestinalis ATCC 50506]ADM11209.1 putative RNA-binding protein [Encephalitozoon intestinalis ATCC 50506]UTX44877.1 nuclear cap-binding protein subunit 2 [Encephalitozoon intestinalis]